MKGIYRFLDYIASQYSDIKGVFNRTYHTSAKRPVPVSNQRVCHHQGDGVRVGPSNSLDRNGDMSQRHLVVAHADLRKRTVSIRATINLYTIRHVTSNEKCWRTVTFKSAAAANCVVFAFKLTSLPVK